jgi:voltage-gated potassium channel
VVGPIAEFRANGGYDLWERNADFVLIPLALIFLVVLLVPLVVHLTPAGQTAFLVANIAIWVAFAVDYFARLYLAPARGRFVRTHVVDLIVVAVPFLRPLRLLRVFGILGEYVSRSRRHLAKRAMVFVAVVAVVAMLAGAAVIFNLEHSKSHANIHSFPDALWWAVGTISTVGTNAYPTTTAGRIVGALMMVTGVALAGIFTAAIATYFIASTDADHTVPSKDADTEPPNVAHELAAMKVSIDRFHVELNQLRVLIAEITGREHDSPTTNTQIDQSAKDETERSDGAVHRIRRGS